MVYMHSNPVQWKLWDIVITKWRGRLIAFIFGALDFACVYWRFLANDGVAESGETARLIRALVDPETGWGAWVTWGIMLLILLPEIRDAMTGKCALVQRTTSRRRRLLWCACCPPRPRAGGGGGGGGGSESDPSRDSAVGPLGGRTGGDSWPSLPALNESVEAEAHP